MRGLPVLKPLGWIERVRKHRVMTPSEAIGTGVSFIDEVAKVDRYRFLREDVRLNPVVKNQKAFLQGLINESRRKRLVCVPPQGVMTETME